MNLTSTFFLPLITTLSLALAPALAAEKKQPMKPIQEVFKPSGSFPESEYMKIAVVQYNPPEVPVLNTTKSDAQKRLKAARQEIISRLDEAVRAGAKFVVFSEFVMNGYPLESHLKDPETGQYESPEQIALYAETIPGAGTRELGAAAKRLGVWLQFGMAEVAEEKGQTVFYNSAVLINPQGEVVGKHRKVNFHTGEEAYLKRGARVADVFETPIGKLGMLICADVYDYSLLNMYRSKGVQVLSLSTSWAQMNTGMKYFREAAVYTRAFLLAANQGYYPDSGVINPNGKNQSHIRQSTDAIAYGYLPLVGANTPRRAR
jgi:predicted amidohydrolase